MCFAITKYDIHVTFYLYNFFSVILVKEPPSTNQIVVRDGYDGIY